MFSKSIYLDRLLLKLSPLSFGFKLSFLFQKYLCIFSNIIGLKFNLKVGYLNYTSKSISDIGTLQSSIIDSFEGFKGLKKFKSVLDIGANVGQFANSVALLNPKSKIISLEPNPRIIEEATFNTRKINVELRNVGLGSENGKIKFYVSANSLTSSFTPEKNTDVIEVMSKRGDTEFANKSFDLIKIDVEGFEYNVLKGMPKLLKNSKYLLLELSFDREQEMTNLDVLTLVKEICPKSSIIRFGRELKDGNKLLAQDVLIKLS